MACPLGWNKGPPWTTHPSHQRQLHAVIPARRVVTEDNDVHQTQLVVQFATRQEEPVPNRGDVTAAIQLDAWIHCLKGNSQMIRSVNMQRVM